MNSDFFQVTCIICNNHFWIKSRVPTDQYTCDKCKSTPAHLNYIDPYHERMYRAQVQIVNDPGDAYSVGSRFYPNEIREAIILWRKDHIERFTDHTKFRFRDDKKQARYGTLDYASTAAMLIKDIKALPLEKLLRRA